MSNSLLNGMFITPPSKTSQTALQYAGYRSSLFRPRCIQSSARASTDRITKAKNVARIGIHNNPEPTAIPLRSAFFFILGIAIEHKVVTNDHLDGSSGASERDSN